MARSIELLLSDQEDISGAGSIYDIDVFKEWTLYLKTEGAVDITIELSIDAFYYFEIDESPESFGSADTKVLKMSGYEAKLMWLKGSNSTEVTAQICGLY